MNIYYLLVQIRGCRHYINFAIALKNSNILLPKEIKISIIDSYLLHGYDNPYIDLEPSNLLYPIKYKIQDKFIKYKAVQEAIILQNKQEQYNNQIDEYYKILNKRINCSNNTPLPIDKIINKAHQ